MKRTAQETTNLELNAQELTVQEQANQEKATRRKPRAGKASTEPSAPEKPETEPTTQEMPATESTDLFASLTAQSSVAESSGRRLDHTAELNRIAAERATVVIKKASENPELRELANRMLQGNPADLMELFEKTGALETVSADAQTALTGASEDELKRLLESRRSDRSKCKKKGIGSSMLVCRNYVACMYAELMVRNGMGKPYTGTRGVAGGSTLDESDLDAVKRRVKSLQSKKCRIKKLADAGVAGAQAELDEVEAEIERLNALRPTAKVSTKVAVKSIKVDELRAALEKIEGDVPEEILALMAKLG